MSTAQIARIAHPAVGVLRAQGRSVAWLAREAGRVARGTPYDRSWMSQILYKHRTSSPALRAAVAHLLGAPESDLFHTEPPSEAKVA